MTAHGMEKIHYQTDQEDLFKACEGKMARVFEPGELTGKIKSASASFLTDDDLNRFRPDKDHFLMHLTAMGATEDWGWNRNQDGYKRAMLERDHSTFVKYGHYFEEHRNRDPKIARGTIKFSAINPDMHRVELFVWGDIKKAAEDYEAARSGKPLSYSMSCKIPFDVSECCGHKAATIADHCSHLKHQGGQYLPEFQRYAYVDNPYCKFFDISKVANPADRTAHYLAYRFPDQDKLAKAASSNVTILGTDWADYEGVNLPAFDSDEPLAWSSKHQAIFDKLACEAAYVAGLTKEAFASSDPKVAYVNLVGPNLFTSPIEDTALNSVRNIRPGVMAHEMAKRAMVLPFPAFFALVAKKSTADVTEDENFKAACAHMPTAWEAMTKEGGCLCGNLHGEFEPESEFMSRCDPGNNDEVQSFMDHATQSYGITPEPVQSRIIQITIKGASLNSEKNSEKKEASNEGNFYAQAYGQYLTQALVSMEKYGHSIGDREILALAGYVNSLAYT